MLSSLHEQVQEIERLANRLEGLLVDGGQSLANNNMRNHAERLAYWVEGYRHGLRYGLLAADESLDSLDNRDRPPAGKSAQPEARDFIESAHKVSAIVSGMEQKPVPVPPSDQSASTLKKEDAMQHTHVKDLMKKDPVIISGSLTLEEAAQEMEMTNCGALPVGTHDRVEGIITDRDIVLRAVAKGKDASKEKVRDYMTLEVCSVQEDDTPDRAAGVMRAKNINRVLVEDEEGRTSGILTFGRILRENDSMQEIATIIECAVGRKAA